MASDHSRRKFTPEQVREIRALWHTVYFEGSGYIGLTEIARRYGVARKTIWLIMHRQGTYSDVP